MQRRRPSIAALAVLVALSSACSDDDPASPPSVAVGRYLSELPAWQQYSPPLDAIPPTPVGSATTAEESIPDVPVYDPATRALVGHRTEKYDCTTRRFSMRDTPEKIVMFSPDVELLWPGALIQGKSHRDGIGSLQGLTIAERTPISVSIPALATANNYVVVEAPDQARVTAAIGAMVRDATVNDLSTPSTIQFLMEDHTSDESFALSAKLSGRYMGFSASASGSYQRTAKEHTVMVYFFEKMFEVVVAPPQTPGAFFTPAFTEAKLQEQIALQKLGPDNPPVYVSNVVYGRMMAFTLTSTANSSEIKAALNAAYKGIFSASVSLSAEHRKLLSEAKISITSLGGDAKATVAMIASGDWRQYFSEGAPLTSAAPISYTFRNLRDGSIASVAEATEYAVKECNLKDSAFSGFLLESFESANALAGRCAATTTRACSTDSECQTCVEGTCELRPALTCASSSDCEAMVCRRGVCALGTNVPCADDAVCGTCPAGGTCPADGSACTAGAACAAICDPSWSVNPPSVLTWRPPETADSIFYGYVNAKHTNQPGGYCQTVSPPACVDGGCADPTLTCVPGEGCRRACAANADCSGVECKGNGAYAVSFLAAPEAFKGDKLDFYKGELSYWFQPSRTIYNVPFTRTQQICVAWSSFLWWTWCSAYQTITTLTIPAFEEVRQSDIVYGRDDATSFDQVVLRGGKPPYGIATLTYNPPGEELSRGWNHYGVPLTNGPACDPDPLVTIVNTNGCWMLEDAVASEEDIQYVLGNVLDFRLRASYPVYRVGTAGYCAVTVSPTGCTTNAQCTDAARPVCVDGTCTRPCAAGADCAGLGAACRPEALLYGYVGGDFDEVKFIKEALP